MRQLAVFDWNGKKNLPHDIILSLSFSLILRVCMCTYISRDACVLLTDKFLSRARFKLGHTFSRCGSWKVSVKQHTTTNRENQSVKRQRRRRLREQQKLRNIQKWKIRITQRDFWLCTKTTTTTKTKTISHRSALFSTYMYLHLSVYIYIYAMDIK